MYRRADLESKLNYEASHHTRPLGPPSPIDGDSNFRSSESKLSTDGDEEDALIVSTSPEEPAVHTGRQGGVPVTPIQVYDFSTKAAYEDANKLLHVDSLADDIRWGAPALRVRCLRELW